MEIEEVTFNEYQNILSNPFHIYNSAIFNEHNSEKVERVFYLLFKDKKYRYGIVGGLYNECFLSPFSAPFGGFSSVSNKSRMEYLEQGVENLIFWCKNKNIKKISITLPPAFYNYFLIAFFSKW